jgi:hypothetical protein
MKKSLINETSNARKKHADSFFADFSLPCDFMNARRTRTRCEPLLCLLYVHEMLLSSSHLSLFLPFLLAPGRSDKHLSLIIILQDI